MSTRRPNMNAHALKVMVTCPPMLRMIEVFRPVFDARGIELHTPCVVQTLSEEELIRIVPECDGWIIGDDPATARVFEAAKAGRLKAAVKWGVGVDNVDLAACKRLNIPVANTPGAFGREVADMAIGYIIALARHTFEIDRGVKAGGWPKPTGISLAGRSVALVGFGDIGRNTAQRLLAAEMRLIVYDPLFRPALGLESKAAATWPERLGEADFIAFTCSLTSENRSMLNADTLAQAKRAVRIVNVARGALIDEAALAAALQSGHVHSVALDVFEEEPLPPSSHLRTFGDRCVFGSHNGSNTLDAVRRTSERAIELLFRFLALN